MTELAKYSLGVGDRFAHQAKAQLQACVKALDHGVEIGPVWNKSYREHSIVGSRPESVRVAADAAVAALRWTLPYHVDADHIRLETVDAFLSSSDFYTIDVAECIGRAATDVEVDAFLGRHPELTARQIVAGIEHPLELGRAEATRIARKYLAAAREAGAIHRHICAAKGAGTFIAEVSMDETDMPQTPPELLVILAALADEQIPLQTIAPKFTGRFNKGVDYVGDATRFECEFLEDIAIIEFAVERYGLPRNLKLSVHSGSDKFSIYEPMRRALGRTGAGVHVKTAGTTWLEELIGLAEAGGEGLAIAREIYAGALEKREALCAPYAAVIDIDVNSLPSASEVAGWPSDRYVRALRHDQACAEFNPSLRQLLHVGYKVAAQMGARYLDQLASCEPTIARNVTENLYERHIRPLFLGAQGG